MLYCEVTVNAWWNLIVMVAKEDLQLLQKSPCSDIKFSKSRHDAYVHVTLSLLQVYANRLAEKSRMSYCSTCGLMASINYFSCFYSD